MFSKYSKRQWLILCVHIIVNVFSALAMSLQGPFFPEVVESVGGTPTDNGLIFGSYSLIIIFINPLVTVMINKFGAVEVAFYGILITGISNVLFGFVDRLNGVVLFVSLSVISRVIEGAGYAMGRNAGLAVITFEFSENIERAFAIVQTFFSFGLIIGPVAGGALYEVGGFYLPFVLIGVLLVLIAFVVLFLPKDYPKHESKPNKQMVKLIRQPSIILGMLFIIGAFFNFSFIFSVFELHIKNLNLSPVQIGALFLCNGIANVLSSFFWGLLFEKYNKPLLLCSLCAFISIFGMLLLGPAPYLFLDLNIYTCIFGLVIQGIGFGGEQIGGFSLLDKGTLVAGLPQNIQTSGIVSGLYTSSFAIGSFIGPLIGGYLFDVVGFPWGSHLFIVYQLVLSITMIICNHLLRDRLVITGYKKHRNSTESIEMNGTNSVNQILLINNH